MDKQKLIVVIMGQNCQKFIGMSLESVKNADAIIYCDGGSTDETILKAISKNNGLIVIENKYNQEDKTMNGKQRNFYLNYLKENYPDYWCLCIDADEIVEDLDKIKKFINETSEGLYSVKMRHLIGDFGHEDNTTPEHYVLNRLFKISCAKDYPKVEHPVLQGNPSAQNAKTDCTTIWHLAYTPNMWDIKKRYDNHMKKSEMHTPEYLKNWYYSHLFGKYPKKQIDITDLPKELLNEFGIDKDEFYFMNRGVEVKHFIMMRQWIDLFEKNVGGRFDVIDLGCGRAPYGFALKSILPNSEYIGIEKSKYAVDNAFVPIEQGDITEYKLHSPDSFGLVLAIDVLEHLNDEELEKALKNIERIDTKYIIFSIPFIGDPNLTNDKTHKQFMTKEQWIKKIESFGIKIKETPDWLFKEQILVGEK